ncbi:4-(cytidine 5'-diphospho)-2-C-methyl-D-erythritol kinase [Breoghania sp. L-A4]|uniref:4-(cytidine 5'-diphospho)-2-C-methyl-D-erythritol kinase n=1 Tax=Breoghania sp. L-A4 TaxID=2304600 RepID=UPI000E35B403|nr:4-(cytidine 5'-diphospho)-2-C-methyl-D-erythritol kinase [Breoghania sp. L-A4]AXS42649.1 4-(cytidine 5'-diphospho)-2-C-methyl-D-erythritol kinase [Breoghania sp. L-A4]
MDDGSGSGAATIVARAKINLALHVTGRRSDGYHLLDTLVAFPDFGDRLSVEPAEALSLTITGPFGAGLPADESNLVMKAARLLANRADVKTGARLVLDKRLPLASGIGGGSADAAAAFRLLKDLWRVDITVAEMSALALEIGADVPMCLASKPLIARGIGDDITLLPPLPDAGIILVNAGAALSTPAVFRRLEDPDNSPLPAMPDHFDGADALCDWLAATRNDLEAPATALAPQIGKVLAALGARPEVMLARMSGSGATCFGVCRSARAATGAAARLGHDHPHWWVRAAALCTPR